jgi:hypothetical protein
MCKAAVIAITLKAQLLHLRLANEDETWIVFTKLGVNMNTIGTWIVFSKLGVNMNTSGTWIVFTKLGVNVDTSGAWIVFTKLGVNMNTSGTWIVFTKLRVNMNTIGTWIVFTILGVNMNTIGTWIVFTILGENMDRICRRRCIATAFQLWLRICHYDWPGKSGELKLNGTHLLLAYADNVDQLGDNIDAINKDTETLIDATKEVGLDINADKTKHIAVSSRERRKKSIQKK